MNLPEPTERRTEWGLLLIFASLSLGIVAGGTFYYRHYERQFRTAAERQLAAIAELKVGELAQYRKERLDAAAIFFNNTAFSGLVRRFFDHPEDADAQQEIQQWTDKLLATDQYDLVRLLDAQGVTRLSSPAAAPPISSVVSQRIPEILRSGQVTFQDFHRNENDRRVYLDILIPILTKQDARRPLGIFYLRIDPEKYLYPFIQHWPVPSQTAETLLVRRDGNDALFLNELKFQTNTALNLRISLKNTNRPAVKAVLGQTGIVEGTDYRGALVLADLRAIPDSPWFLVARTDTAEVFAPMRARLWQVVVMIGILLFGSAACIGLVWRRQRSRFYRAQYELAEALRERAKELNCLYAIADLIEKENSLEKILQGSADIMPKGWVHTEIACTRIILKERQYQTGNFHATDWRQSAALKVDGQPVGLIEICYLEERPIRDEGPFLKEERNLINAIAERLGRVVERTQAEDKLRQLSRAVEQSPASIVITNPAGDIEYVNPKFVAVTGYTLAEVLGKNPRVLKSGEMSPEAYGVLWQTIAAGKEWSGEFHNKKKNGELYWESASISPIRDLAGRVTHYVAVKEDITAHKQTEVERDTLIHDLQDALASVKSLSGLLPICASCKKIRDDQGYWSQVESYIQSHSDATFTHGICPDCIKKLYPDLAEGGLGKSSKETT
jgi:PAS domain S-box-containing protein